MPAMNNLERSIRALLLRAHRAKANKRHCYKEGGVTIMVNSLTAIDPLAPIVVNAEGQAKLPPKPLIATLLLDRLKDERLSYFSVGYAVDKGRITRVRLYDLLTDDEQFWWLTVFTALNVEANERKGSEQLTASRRRRKQPSRPSSSKGMSCSAVPYSETTQ